MTTEEKRELAQRLAEINAQLRLVRKAAEMGNGISGARVIYGELASVERRLFGPSLHDQ